MTATDSPRLPDGRAFAFGIYVLDPVRRLLWCDGKVVAITDKAFDVLATLVAHRDRILGKDELLKRLWPGTFVQENNLVRHVSMVRRALGQSPEEHDFVVTVPGVGYRFVAAVKEMDTPAEFPTRVNGHRSEHPAQTVADGTLLEDDTARADSAVSEPTLAQAEVPENVPSSSELNLDSEPAASAARVIPVASSRESVRTGSRRLLPWLLGGPLVLAGAAILAFVSISSRSTESSTSRSLRQITYGPDVQVGPTWSPDGRAIAFSSNRSGDFEIWVQALDQSEPVRLTWSEGADWQPSWSPDGRLLVFRSERRGGGLYVISPRGEGLREVSSLGYHPTWSPDSAVVLFDSTQVERSRPQPYIVRIDGTGPQPVRPDVTNGWSLVRASWHPDGQVTFWGRDVEGVWTMIKAPLADGPITRYAVPTALTRRMDTLSLTLGRFAWSPAGDFIYFEGESMQVRNLWRVHVNPSTMVWAGPPERLTLGEGADSDMSVSTDGKNIAFAVVKERTRLWALPLAGSADSAPQALTTGGAGEFDADVSADGRVLVYRMVRAGRQELWARSIPDKTEHLLISGTDWVRSTPRLSADGTRVAYRLSPVGARGSNSKPAVAILEPDGTEVVVSAPESLAFIPDDWSADGLTILGGCNEPGSRPYIAVCTIDARPNSTPTLIAKDPKREFHSPHYSPNQRWISVVERAGPRKPNWGGAITVLPTVGGPRIAITDGKWNDEKPRWSSDGKAIYFVSNRNGFVNLWGRRFNPQTGMPEGDVFQVTKFTDLTRLLPTDMSRVETSVSGDRVFLPLTEMTSTIWRLDRADR